MIILIICFIVNTQYCTSNSNLSSVKCAVNDAETLTGVIIKDINKAFNIVTNNTVLLKNLIPEMYNLNVSKTDMVFKLPKLDGSGGTMVSMHRTDFMDPKFPNLTTRYMDFMKERRHILKSVSHKLSDSTVKIQANVYHSSTEGQNDWTALGLEGWTGEVSQPLQYFQQEEMQEPDKPHESNQINALLRDYNLQQIIRHHIGNYDQKNRSIDFCSNGIGQKVAVLNENDDQDGNVYIARVNDPFGFSTKWEFENYTNLEHINLSDTRNVRDDRLKRGVVTLYSMIKCSTGCEPLSYKGYGCYCGFLGAGVPVDGIDRCCKLHDKCYEKSNCISYLEYFVPYIWKCYGGKPLCAIDHGEFGGPQSCAARLCYCDMRLSRCLRKFGCPRRRAVCRTSTARQLQNLLLF